MNSLQGMDRYQNEVIQVSSLKNEIKCRYILRYCYLFFSLMLLFRPHMSNINQNLLSLQNRFFVLKTGLRVTDMNKAAILTIDCVILHNMSIKHGDNGDQLDPPALPGPQDVPQVQEPQPHHTIEAGREGRRKLLLNNFI